MPNYRVLPALLLSAAALVLSGCGLGTPATATPASMALHITGNVHGGQQPVAGAHVHFFQAYTSASGRSLDLFIKINTDSPSVSTSDALGSYVPADANGNFSVTGLYDCAGTGPVYLLATQGNPGLTAGTNNAALSLLSVVADACSSSGTLSPTLTINVNEISTVAGVYSLAGYLSAPNALLYPGNSGSYLPKGLVNAADTALALVNLPTGTVNATTAAGGIVPAAAITSLANSIAPCINSNGTGNGCSALFAAATSDGTSSGTVPTDTVTALINIAHHPAANVAAIYNLSSATPPFAGGLTTQPNDFTLAISYSSANTGLNSPGIPAVDAAGNVWFASTTAFGGNYYANELSPLGAKITYSALNNQPTQAAIDPSGNAWFAQRGGGVVSRANAASSASNYPYNGTNTTDDGHQIAIDGGGNVLISDNTTGGLFEVNNSGVVNGSAPYGAGNSSGTGFHNVALLNSTTLITVANGNYISPYADPIGTAQRICGTNSSCGPAASPTALAVDSSANIWALNDNSTLAGFTSTGTGTNGNGALSGSPYSGGGLNTTTVSASQPYPWLAIDGANVIWISNYTGNISAFANTGTALSPSTGFYGSTLSCKGQGAAIDGSGNIWVGCDSQTAPVLEYIGLATPVTTPLLPGIFGVKP